MTLPLPPGLFFTVGAEPVPVSNFFVFPTTGVPTPGAPVFSWLLFGSSPTVVVPESGSIAGSGAVTIPDFPFFLLVPGRFVVEAAETAELPPVNGAEEAPGEATAKGLLPFRTVYEVIPHDRKPGLSGISERIISRRGGRATGKILVTNRGNVPLEGLAVSGSSRDFRIGLPARTSLGPGESTTCPVTFIARRGVRASVMVSLTAKTPDRSYTPETAPGAAPETSAPGEIPEETGPIVIPGTRVKSKVLVRGEVTDSRSRGRSPRFPFGL